MKTCLVCSKAEAADEATTCTACGEGSWSETVAPEPKKSAPPPAKNGKR